MREGTGERIEHHLEHGNTDQLRQAALHGLPDEPESLRARVWSALLDLPIELSEQYMSFLAVVDTPQVVERHSRVLVDIANDVAKTHAGGLAWFNKRAVSADQLVGSPVMRNAGGETVSPPSTSRPHTATGDDDNDNDTFVTPPDTPKPAPVSLVDDIDKSITNRQALTRPLFVYAVLNAGISYVQGMNSIIAVLSYCFARQYGDEPQHALRAEAATFFAFGAIVNRVQDLYLAESSNEAIKRIMASYTQTLEWVDEEVLFALEDKSIDPFSFVFRWITTLFSQEFAVPDVLRIWDRLVALASISAHDMQDHLVDLAVALTVEERLVITSPYADFARCIKTLQDPQLDGAQVDALVANAWQIRETRLLKQAGMPEWRIAAIKWSSTLKERFASRSATSPDSQDDDDVDTSPAIEIKDENGNRTSTWSDWRSAWSTKLASSDAAAHLAKHRTNLSISASRLATSDAAASLSKASSNLSAQASLFSSQIATQAPGRFNRIRSNVQAASSRFMASTASSQSPVRRPGSPVEPPFTPPTHFAGGGDSPGMSRRPTLTHATYNAHHHVDESSISASPFAGPKPLLLSTSTSRSPSTSTNRSPSTSPTALRSSISIAPLGHARSPSPVHSSTFDAPLRKSSADHYAAHVENAGEERGHSRANVVPASSFQARPTVRPRQASAGLMVDMDVPISSLRLDSSPVQSVPHSQDGPLSPVGGSARGGDTVATAGPRLKRSAAARRRSTDYSSLGVSSTHIASNINAVPSNEGRGWSLVDKPVALSVDTANVGGANANGEDDTPTTADDSDSRRRARRGSLEPVVENDTIDSRPPPSRKSSLPPSLQNSNDEDGDERVSTRPTMSASHRRRTHGSTRSTSSGITTTTSGADGDGDDDSSTSHDSALVNTDNRLNSKGNAVKARPGSAGGTDKAKRRSVSEFLVQKARPAIQKRSSSSSYHQGHKSRPSITDVLEEYY